MGYEIVKGKCTKFKLKDVLKVNISVLSESISQTLVYDYQHTSIHAVMTHPCLVRLV